MTFTYKLSLSGKLYNTTIGIFDTAKDYYKTVAPFYILLIVYGSYYVSLKNDEDKANFTFFQKIMNDTFHTINVNIKNFHYIYFDYLYLSLIYFHLIY